LFSAQSLPSCACTIATDRPRELTLRARTLGGDRVQVDEADTGPGIVS